MVHAHTSHPAHHNSTTNKHGSVPEHHNSTTHKPGSVVAKNTGSHAPTSSHTPTTTQKQDEKSKLSPGAIAGIVIGSIALVLMISFAVYKIKNQ